MLDTERSLAAALTIVIACASACGIDSAESPADDDGASAGGKGDIIGQNDLIPVDGDGGNIPERYRPLLDAIGLIELRVDGKRLHCTGTHIGGGIMITAGHCFKDFGVGLETVAGLPLAPGSCTVQWGVRSDNGGYLNSDCTKLLGARFDPENFDGAVVVVSPAPSARIPLASETVADGARITMFSHPRARALEWSQSCHARPGPIATTFFHDCDSEPGSSGAAILDNATLTIVGIHNAGLDYHNRASVIYEGLEF